MLDHNDCITSGFDVDLGLPNEVIVDFTNHPASIGTSNHTKYSEVNIVGFRENGSYRQIPLFAHKLVLRRFLKTFRGKLKDTRIYIGSPEGRKQYDYDRSTEVGEDPFETYERSKTYMTIDDALSLKPGDKVVCMGTAVLPGWMVRHPAYRPTENIQEGVRYTVERTNLSTRVCAIEEEKRNVVIQLEEIPNGTFGHSFFRKDNLHLVKSR